MAKLGSKLSDTFVADLTNGFVNTAQTGIVLVTFVDTDTTPTVAASNSFLASNTVPTSITNFDDGVEGQVIRIQFTNANTTIVHDVTKIKLAGGTNVTPATNTALVFTRDTSGIWWQVGGGGALFATPSIVLGAAAAAGAATTVIRSDSTIAAFNDGANPSPSNPGDTADTGNDAFAARRDHVHARERLLISTLAFFDDFMAEPTANPSPGASGTWFTATAGGGSSVGFNNNDTDDRALGVWNLLSGTTAGSHFVSISPHGSASFGLRLIPGIRFGCSVKSSSTLFTRAHLMFGINNLDMTTGSINDGTESMNFGMWAGGTSGYPLDADGEKDTLYFRARHGGNDTIFKFGTASTYNTFKNIEMRVTAEQTVECYEDGVLITTISGTSVPPSTQALSLRFRMETRGSSDPASAQASFIDRVWIDTSGMSRGSI